MKVKFKKMNEKAILPSYAKEGDAGLDLYPVEGPIFTEKYIEYDFGISVEIPKGFAGFLFSRSSISKTDLELCNSVGIIDSGYRGSIKARFNFNQFSLDFLQRFDIEVAGVTQYQRDKLIDKFMNKLSYFEEGKAILQLIIMPVPSIEPEWADELSETPRGSGGFGSTDK